MSQNSAKTRRRPFPETCPSFRSGHLPEMADVERLRSLTAPHVESFNYFLDHGLSAGVADIEPAELDLIDPNWLRDPATQSIDWDDVSTLQFWVQDAVVAKPSKPVGCGRNNILLPRECRERGILYAGHLTATLAYRIVQRRNGVAMPGRPVLLTRRDFGQMPIMVMSRNCHLQGTTPKELVKLKEEDNEFGGYFIVGGIERCVRMLQIPRRHHATAIQRANYKNRGPTYTDLGVSMRCSRHNHDMSSITNTIHYLTTGGINLRFVARKQEFLIPAVLIARALSGASVDTGTTADAAAGIGHGMGITDEEMFRRIILGDDSNTFLVARAHLLLQDARARFTKLNTPEECLKYIGQRFRRLTQKAETTSDEDIGHYMIRRYILIHLEDYGDKLECLFFLMRKLYSFASGDCGDDNADSLQNQEILLPGHLMSAFVKEKFDEFLQALRLGILNDLRKEYERTSAKLVDLAHWSKLIDRYSGRSSGSIGKKVSHFLSTGNVVSTTGLDLMQVSGFTIVAEKLNFLRYCAHFRSVHRGQYFMEMKTTAVRKLLPDQWGFLCPVHTPDGGPCGLLSHLSIRSTVTTHPETFGKDKTSGLESLLIALGVIPTGTGYCNSNGQLISSYKHMPVVLDGKVIGAAAPDQCLVIANHLRELKVQEPCRIAPTVEVGLIPKGNAGAPYPGLFLFTGAARLVRPVLQRSAERIELIGPLEQAFMDIACLESDIRIGITTHQELDPANMLSLIANLTPYSDHNQSPRNMYQCQMGKQTMGTPCHALSYRADNKLYKIQTPQAPIVQTATHGEYKMDEYPNGTNAIVAVLSYTGYDMEDAMTLSKASYERGLAHASIYKTLEVDLLDEAKLIGSSSSGSSDVRLRFQNKSINDRLMHISLTADGLPLVGDEINEGDPLCSIVDSVSGQDKVVKHKDREVAYIQSVRAIGNESDRGAENKVSITLRYPRNPVIGDKFSSRHGQKGVLSILWPQEDMPFSESGISPDIIINPHAFPSRMTIGMLVESMAGKAGCLHGHYQDGTPFTFHESSGQVAVDFFGDQLEKAGYNYYGSEPLYSGVSGCILQADLYIGVVYYQRLRHMVSDKYQVRATGPTNNLTRQPIKGRKKGGGIRFGEMERDSLLSHGAAFLLQDRLLNCSDRHVAYACSRCGDLLFPTTERSVLQTTGQSASDALNKPKLRLFCRNPLCLKEAPGDEANDPAVEPIIIPYVFRYLANELAGMNVKMTLDIR